MADAELRLGRWESVLSDVEYADIILADPPYSSRTHDGERGMRLTPDEAAGHARKPLGAIAYEAITEADIAGFVEAWAERCRWWAIIFGDHTSFRRWEAAWSAADWLTFAPVIWHKRGAAPRFGGDGPASVVEYLCVARPKRRVRDYNSRPGLYEVQVGPSNPNGSETGVVGTKDIAGLRRILSDYTRPGDLVVDPFAGTATVGQACIELGRRYVDSEMDPETHAKGLARLEQASPDPVLADRWREPRRQSSFGW